MSEKYLKRLNVWHLALNGDPICYKHISKWTHLLKCTKPRSDLHYEPFQTVRVHTEIWPAQLFKAEWIQIAIWGKWHRHWAEGAITGSEWETEVGQQLAARRRGSMRNKEILLRASGREHGHGPEHGAAIRTPTSALITPWAERGVGANGHSDT